jgi:hypothetical protein
MPASVMFSLHNTTFVWNSDIESLVFVKFSAIDDDLLNGFMQIYPQGVNT